MTVVQMTAHAAAELNNGFDDLAAEFHSSIAVVTTLSARIEDGAGEFADTIADGAAAFAVSWREAFQICGTTAGVIAGNTNAISIDLGALDRDASTTITL